MAGAIVYAKSNPACDPAPAERIELRHGGVTRLVPPSEIFWIEASGNYIEFHTIHGTILARQSLTSVGDLLRGNGFLSSHRGALVNSAHVCAIKAGGEQASHTIVLSSGDHVPLSRRKLGPFKALMRKS